MSMQKIFFGTIVFFSLAFLAACGGGGSGSSGAAGAKGDAGADGAPGTIAVPTDADLALTASATADTDESLGEVGRDFYLSGIDNVSLDSRLRYYGYLGTSSTYKSVLTVSGVSATNSVNQANPYDPRMLAAGGDNITYTLTANNDLGLGGGEITHLIVCPGNEAGDATTCATAAIEDMGVTYGYSSAAGTDTSGGTSGDLLSTDNSSFGMVVAHGSGDDFSMFHVAAPDGDNLSNSRGVFVSALTDAKGSAVTVSGESAAHNISGSYAVTGGVAAMGTSDAVYLLVQDNITTDNGTFYYRSASSGNLASGTGTLNDLHGCDACSGAVGIRKGAMLLPVSSTKAYAVWARSGDNVTHFDNSTEVFASFLTLSAGTVTASNVLDSLVAKTNDNTSQRANAGLYYGNDNGTMPSDFPICAAARAETKALGSYAGGTTTAQLAIGFSDGGYSDGVNPSYNVRFTADSDNFSSRATATDVGVNASSGGQTGDNATMVCAMTWAEGLVGVAAATDNGTLWWAGNTSTDNTSDIVSLRSTTLADNGSTATFTAAGSDLDYGKTVHQLALSYDYLNRPYMAALLDNGSVRLHWSAAGGTPVAYNGGQVTEFSDNGKPISLVRSADGKQLALSYHTDADHGGDIRVVVIYADGSSD